MIESIIEVKEETLEDESVHAVPINASKQSTQERQQYAHQHINANVLETLRGKPAVTYMVPISKTDQDDTLFTRIGPTTYTLKWNPEAIQSNEGNEDPLQVETSPLFDVPPQIRGYPQVKQQMKYGTKRKLQEHSTGTLRYVSVLSATHSTSPDSLEKTKKNCSQNKLTESQVFKDNIMLYSPNRYVTLHTDAELFTDVSKIEEKEIKEELGFISESSSIKQNSTVTASSRIVSSQINVKPAANKQKHTSDHRQHKEPVVHSNPSLVSTCIVPINIDETPRSSTLKSHIIKFTSPTSRKSKTSQLAAVTTQPPTVCSNVVPVYKTSKTSNEVKNKLGKYTKNTMIDDSNAEIELVMEVTEVPSRKNSIMEKKTKISILDRIDELLKKNEQIMSYSPQSRIPEKELQNNVYIQAIRNDITVVNMKEANKSITHVNKPKKAKNISNERDLNESVDSYNQPVITFASDNDPLAIPNVETNQCKKDKPKAKTVYCKHCKKGFDTKQEVDEHIKASLQNCMKFPCLVCKTYFCNLVKFNDHMVNIHKICKVCNKKFNSKYEYTLHEAHHKAGSIVFYTCCHCINDYKSKTDLKDHILKVHPGETVKFDYEVKKVPYGCSTVVPNQCVYCDRIYTCSTDLVKHLRRHNIGVGPSKK